MIIKYNGTYYSSQYEERLLDYFNRYFKVDYSNDLVITTLQDGYGYIDNKYFAIESELHLLIWYAKIILYEDIEIYEGKLQILPVTL